MEYFCGREVGIFLWEAFVDGKWDIYVEGRWDIFVEGGEDIFV